MHNETCSAELPLTSSSVCSGKAASTSWFSTRARIWKPQEPLFSSEAVLESVQLEIAALEELAEKQKEEKTEDPPKKKQKEPKWSATRSRKIRLFPTPEQRLLLQAAFDATRHVYNKTVEVVNKHEMKCTRKNLRANAVNDAVWKATKKDKAWEQIDYELRDGAMLDAFKAIKSTKESLKARGLNYEKKWKFKGRRKKDTTESFPVRARRMNNSNLPFYKHLFGRAGARTQDSAGKSVPIMASSKPLPDVFESDMRIWHHKVLGTYFLIIPEEAPMVVTADDTCVPDTQGHGDVNKDARKRRRRNMIGIDPGVRDIATCYDPDGLSCQWGCSGRKKDNANAKLWNRKKDSANAKLWKLANI